MVNKRNGRETTCYMKVKERIISIDYTDDLFSVMKDEYDSFIDTTDNLFGRYPDIRVFVKEESLFTEKPSVNYYQNDELMMTFNGTVFFAKLGKTKVRSLSKKETEFLLKNLSRNDDGTYSISAEA